MSNRTPLYLAFCTGLNEILKQKEAVSRRTVGFYLKMWNDNDEIMSTFSDEEHDNFIKMIQITHDVFKESYSDGS